MKLWLELTRPFHKLTQQQTNVLALLLYYYFEYRKDITNSRVLWKEVFDYDTKTKIQKELNIKPQGIQNVLTALRKKEIIQGNEIIKTYVPNIEYKAKEFNLLFKFNIVDG